MLLASPLLARASLLLSRSSLALELTKPLDSLQVECVRLFLLSPCTPIASFNINVHEVVVASEGALQKVRELILHRNPSRFPLSLPLQDLRELTLLSPSLSTLKDMLSQSPNLLALTLKRYLSSGGNIWIPSHLKLLDMEGIFQNYFFRITLDLENPGTLVKLPKEWHSFISFSHRDDLK